MASRLPDTLDRIEAQRAAGRSIVLVAVLLGAALSLAALLLAGRLVAAVRDEERVLLVAFGASRRQQLVAAGFEAVLLALVAAGLALPAAALVHSWLTHLAGPAAAGLTQAPTVTGGLVLTVLGCTLVARSGAGADRRRHEHHVRGHPAPLGAGPRRCRLDPHRGGRGGRRVLAWWQLRGQPDTTAGRGDVTLTLAPVVCLVATTLVVVRLVPVLLRAASRLALRSPALVLPLSVQQAARRPHPGTAMVLIAAAVAAATFGLGLRSTWERSQVDQADLRVGTDLSLDRAHDADRGRCGGRARRGRGAVRGRLGGRSTDRWPSAATSARRTRRRPWSPSTATWPVTCSAAGSTTAPGAALAARLDPGPAVTGLALADGATTLRGRSAGALPITATATAVVEGTTGLRHTLTAAPVPLDGQVHPLTWSEPVDDGLRLVALALHLDGPSSPGADEIAAADVDLTVTVPGGAATDGSTTGTPSPRTRPGRRPVRHRRARRGRHPAADRRRGGHRSAARRRRGPAGHVLRRAGPAYRWRCPKTSPTPSTPRSATRSTGNVGATPLPLKVVAVVPDVPSAPGRPAVLADVDAVSRSLIAGGAAGAVRGCLVGRRAHGAGGAGPGRARTSGRWSPEPR